MRRGYGDGNAHAGTRGGEELISANGRLLAQLEAHEHVPQRVRENGDRWTDVIGKKPAVKQNWTCTHTPALITN